jgi:hypothetical protein
MLDVFTACFDRFYRDGYAALTDAERVVVLVGSFYFEVKAHGFAGYYGNPSGNYSLDAVWALRQVGATQAAAALGACNGLFHGGAPSADRVARWEAIKPFLVGGPIDRMEAEYLPHHPEVWELLDRYVQDPAVELPVDPRLPPDIKATVQASLAASPLAPKPRKPWWRFW